MKKALAILLLLLPTLLLAETTVKGGGWSTHFSDREYNSFHRLLLINHKSWFGGYLRNSYNDDTFTAGKTYSWNDKGLKLNLYLGATYGYRETSRCYKYQGYHPNNKKIVCPLIAPELELSEVPLKPSVMLAGNAILLTIGFDI